MCVLFFLKTLASQHQVKAKGKKMLVQTTTLSICLIFLFSCVAGDTALECDTNTDCLQGTCFQGTCQQLSPDNRKDPNADVKNEVDCNDLCSTAITIVIKAVTNF